MRVLVYRGRCYAKIIEKSKIGRDFFVVADDIYTFSMRGGKCDYYLEMAADKSARLAYDFFSEAELFEVIYRDRYLRSISLTQALQLVYNVTGQIIDIIVKEKPILIVSHATDSCSMDILFRVAERYHIQCCSICAYSICNYFMMYDHSKHVFYKRKIPLEDFNLESVLFPDESKPLFYSVKASGNICQLLTRLHKLFGSILMQLRFKNPFNPDVKNKNFYAMCCNARIIPMARLNLRDLSKKYYDSLNDVPVSNKKVVYISLHCCPEASIDYDGSKPLSLIDHDRLVVDILSKFHDKYVFLVKEHPLMYNCRTLDLYDKIKKIPDVYLLHPSTNYIDVVKRSSVVVSWGGTVGVVAPFLGAKTLNIGKPLYYLEGFDNCFSDYHDLMSNFSDKIENANFVLEDYKHALNELFGSILFKGDLHRLMFQDDEHAYEEVSQCIDSLFF